MVSPMTAAANSKLMVLSQSLITFGRNLVGTEIPEEKLDQKRRVPEKLEIAVGEPADRPDIAHPHDGDDQAQ